MTYPFKPVEHRIYKKTFLKDVKVIVEFSQVDFSKVNRQFLEGFFSLFSGAKVDCDKFVKDQRVSIVSEDHNIEFVFCSDYAEAKLCTPLYTCFDNAKQFWNKIQIYLENLGVKHLKRLIVRKYSALYFKSDTADYNVRSVMNNVFCKDLMTFIPTEINTDSSLNSLEKTWSQDDDTTKTSFNVVFGIKKSDSVDRNDRLTLITSLESKDNPFDTTELMNRIEKYNKTLYDAFHWCVKENIITKMI